ncbi:hypothetical protein F8R89_29785 [Streptomyces sp. SS1-1]|uniref:hypothetical protein n=1 Tax=Streptomyces sp. SS1-1 TaxID=2651869 RepID=UPI00124FEB61|nr:hypothetical protein [Streptomyces sp. SS1-1]KAB2975817.1 hypothetical protein F8R89_29785 [Streptomyces sp. SS1-1]
MIGAASPRRARDRAGTARTWRTTVAAALAIERGKALPSAGGRARRPAPGHLAPLRTGRGYTAGVAGAPVPGTPHRAAPGSAAPATTAVPTDDEHRVAAVLALDREQTTPERVVAPRQPDPGRLTRL